MAARTRSLLSLTVASGRPTVFIRCCSPQGLRSTSTLTGNASSPYRAVLITRQSMATSVRRIRHGIKRRAGFLFRNGSNNVFTK